MENQTCPDTITTDCLREFAAALVRAEKSPATVVKYTRYAAKFARFLGNQPLAKERVLDFKNQLAQNYTAAGANGMLAAVNSLLIFLGVPELRVSLLRVQARIVGVAERELNRAELSRLLNAAQNPRLYWVMQTLFATGCRVGELRYITVEALRLGCVEVRLKNKTRVVILTRELCRRLLAYAKSVGIRSGSVFVTRSGKPLDRTNIWAEMKRLCAAAKVDPAKVFPHNLRHLFARSYYQKHPNLADLAAILGHSDVNTTRIYTAATPDEFRRKLDKLKLVL